MTQTSDAPCKYEDCISNRKSFLISDSTRKGNRPSYIRSARPELAIPLFEKFTARLQQDFGKPIQTGEFGADMQVSLVNDGPVTIIVDSKWRE